MSHFNADTYLEALAVPSITIGGKTHKGRLLSVDEVAELQQRWKGYGENDSPITDLKEMVAAVCKVNELPDEVTQAVAKFPLPAMRQFLEDFLQANLAQTPASSAEAPAAAPGPQIP